MANETVQIVAPDENQLVASAQYSAETATGLVIANNDDYDAAGAFLAEVKKKAKVLDEQRKLITKPLDDAKKRVMDLFRRPLEILAEAEGQIKKTMLAYQTEVDRKRREEEAKKRAEEAARIAEAEELAAQGLIDEASIEPAKPVELETPEPKAAGIHTRDKWSAEVTDFKSLVRFVADNPQWSYLIMANQAELNGLAGVQKEHFSIPGVTAKSEKILVSRR